MKTATIRELRVAVVQTVSKLGHMEANLANAHTLIQQAAGEGAQLVLLPELMPSGYSISPTVWMGAEDSNGKTAQWLKSTAKEFSIYLGTSFIETIGVDFFNSFVLATPEGEEAGRVFKEHAETYLFKNVPGTNHVIETPLGRIGVGICGDNQYASLIPELIQKEADMILMPHAWPVPYKESRLVSQEDIERQHTMAAQTAPFYAAVLGIPAVFCNQAGPVSGEKGIGITAGFMNSPDFYFPGLSTIADSDGGVVAQLGKEQGFVIGRVHLDPAKKKSELPPTYGKWVNPGSVMRDVLFTVDGTAGRIWYACNTQRKARAKRIQA